MNLNENFHLTRTTNIYTKKLQKISDVQNKAGGMPFWWKKILGMAINDGGANGGGVDFIVS